MVLLEASLEAVLNWLEPPSSSAPPAAETCRLLAIAFLFHFAVAAASQPKENEQSWVSYTSMSQDSSVRVFQVRKVEMSLIHARVVPCLSPLAATGKKLKASALLLEYPMFLELVNSLRTLVPSAAVLLSTL